MSKDIVLAVDYHAQNIEYRWFNRATGEERTGRYATSCQAIRRQVAQARAECEPGGQVIWIMESTTGWVRVKEALGDRAKLVLCNVLQMPLAPKARRRKSDKLDTARLLREYLNGELPTSFQPEPHWRQARRLVDCRAELVERQTAIKNWITSLLHHETWADRRGLWSRSGLARLRAMAWPESDRMLVELKLAQLEQLANQQAQVEAAMQALYEAWPDAQRLDAVRGIGMVTAVTLLAHLGPIERFGSAESLIAYVGLAPGTRGSDQTVHHGRIGGGGTDGLVRQLLIEASRWLCQIPRYRPAYERALSRRGPKVARIVMARMLLRSVYKMLHDGVGFNPDRRPTAVTASL